MIYLDCLDSLVVSASQVVLGPTFPIKQHSKLSLIGRSLAARFQLLSNQMPPAEPQKSSSNLYVQIGGIFL